MDSIQRLVKVAAGRNKRRDYATLKFRCLESIRSKLTERCVEDRISRNAVLEALLSGYNSKHPSALAMVDQWMRDNGIQKDDLANPIKLSANELNEIYAAAESVMIEDEDADI